MQDVEWASIERRLTQRITALNLFLRDIYVSVIGTDLVRLSATSDRPSLPAASAAHCSECRRSLPRTQGSRSAEPTPTAETAPA